MQNCERDVAEQAALRWKWAVLGRVKRSEPESRRQDFQLKPESQQRNVWAECVLDGRGRAELLTVSHISTDRPSTAHDLAFLNRRALSPLSICCSIHQELLSQRPSHLLPLARTRSASVVQERELEQQRDHPRTKRPREPK